jgi:hypothetical protein
MFVRFVFEDNFAHAELYNNEKSRPVTQTRTIKKAPSRYVYSAEFIPFK